MKQNIELLAPGGDIDSIKAAIAAGADAVYCGLNRFNARNRAANIVLEDLNGILRLAHKNSCKVFLTLNIIVVESEIPAFVRLLNKLINTSIDGVIVQDLGMLYLLSRYFSNLEIHASTQLTTHNEGQVKFLNRLNVSRVNLSRELNIDEIKKLTSDAHDNNILTEIFIHGSYCISFSGICYLSSVLAGKSGNRGRCSQPCRDRYLPTAAGNSFPLNLKDNSAYSSLKEIYEAKVDSIKIEGRIKASDYVYTVVTCWRKQIQNFCDHGIIENNKSELYQVFNRDFSDGFLRGEIGEEMFIDNPMDNSIKQFSGIGDGSTHKQLLKEKETYYENKEKTSNKVKSKIEKLSSTKVPLEIIVSGELNTPLKVTVKSQDSSFFVLSSMNLVEAGSYTFHHLNPNKISSEDVNSIGDGNLHGTHRKRTAEHLSYANLLDRLKAINSTEYYIEHLVLQGLQRNLFIPFKELTEIKKKILYLLNGSRPFIDPIDVPLIVKQPAIKIKPTLAVLISSKDDLCLCDNCSGDVFFQLPNSLKDRFSELVDMFIGNKKLIPWFPSILIGEDYVSAVDFLHKVQPKFIVTNNTGIAYEAFSRRVAWVAGPYFNIVNSFSLLCLKEKFNCCGSFISNEINASQLKLVKSPEKFKLYYSIYHPILLMTSRQCLFHRVVGCEKTCIDDDCIKDCVKISSIRRTNEKPLLIEKSRGNYHCIYNNSNFLNTRIVKEIPDKFSGFLIDLRRIETETKILLERTQIIALFEGLLNGNEDSEKELQTHISPSTHTQYVKGI